MRLRLTMGMESFRPCFYKPLAYTPCYATGISDEKANIS